jgi:hypothetical protein
VNLFTTVLTLPQIFVVVYFLNQRSLGIQQLIYVSATLGWGGVSIGFLILKILPPLASTPSWPGVLNFATLNNKSLLYYKIWGPMVSLEFFLDIIVSVAL